MAKRYKELPLTINYEDQEKAPSFSSTLISTSGADISDNGLAFMLGFELYRGHRWWNGEKYVMGYNYDGSAYPNGITEVNAYKLWIADIVSSVNRLRKRLNKNPEYMLQHQWDALVSFYYNTGNIDYVEIEGYEFDLIYFIREGTEDQVTSAIQLDNRKPTRRVAEASLYKLGNYGSSKPRTWLRNEGIQHIRQNYTKLLNKDGTLDKTAQSQAHYSYYKETGKFIKEITELERRKVLEQVKLDADTSIDSSTPIQRFPVVTS